MSESRVPLSGSTLILGPSGVGKTRMTARILERWIDEHGPRDVVVLEFGPEFRRDGDLLGGRLDRFTDVPTGAWHGVLEARAPRAESESATEAVELARDNAERASQLLDAAPTDPRAVFVDDGTIPFQHERGDVARLTAYCDRADCAIVNALANDELGVDDSVSRRERETVRALEAWADDVVRLDGDPDGHGQ